MWLERRRMAGSGPVAASSDDQYIAYIVILRHDSLRKKLPSEAGCLVGGPQKFALQVLDDDLPPS